MPDLWADALAYAAYCGEGPTDDPPEPRLVCVDCGEDWPVTTCECPVCHGTSFEERDA